MKGGVAYDEIIGFHYCLVKRYKVGDNRRLVKYFFAMKKLVTA